MRALADGMLLVGAGSSRDFFTQVAHERKPENEFELKSAAYGKSEIMLLMELVMIHTDGVRRDFTEHFSHTKRLTLRQFAALAANWPRCL